MSNNDNNLPDTIRGSARVRLGHSELAVRPIGLGCMGMSQFYGPADDAHSVATIRTALDLGVDFLDTSDIYGAADVNMGAKIRGFGHNERLIGEAIAGRRDEVVLATKFSARLSEDGKDVVMDAAPNTSQRPARPAYVGWESRLSTCITAIGLILTFPSKRPSGRWPV
jgi:aryl-alcohol dehydrogenase-like predicted oxidoreductase